jgi:hypothetical protein
MKHMWHFMAQVDQIVPVNITMLYRVSQLGGMTMSGCAGLLAAGANCVGFLNQLVHMTVTEQNFPIQYY